MGFKGLKLGVQGLKIRVLGASVIPAQFRDVGFATRPLSQVGKRRRVHWKAYIAAAVTFGGLRFRA